MKAQKLSLPLLLMMLALVLQGYSLVPESNEKPVKLVVDFYPNYAGHLLGVAEIGYHSEYAEKYESAVRTKDLEYLRSNSELLRWEKGDEGPLTSVFVSFPGYLNPDTKEELAEYLHDLNSAIASRSFKDFNKKYKEPIETLDLWSGFALNSYIYDYETEIQKISQILMNNFDAFKYWVWPIESEAIQKKANVMNYQLRKFDIISKWEELTGVEYLAPAYEVVLSTGMANGPTGKSLGYEKEWCYHGEDQFDLVQRICRDAGRRLLVEVCCEKYKEYNPLVCFQVYESLNQYLAEEILSEIGIPFQPEAKSKETAELFALFETIKQQSNEIKAKDLYSIALDNYSKIFAYNSQ